MADINYNYNDYAGDAIPKNPLEAALVYTFIEPVISTFMDGEYPSYWHLFCACVLPSALVLGASICKGVADRKIENSPGNWSDETAVSCEGRILFHYPTIDPERMPLAVARSAHKILGYLGF